MSQSHTVRDPTEGWGLSTSRRERQTWGNSGTQSHGTFARKVSRATEARGVPLGAKAGRRLFFDSLLRTGPTARIGVDGCCDDHTRGGRRVRHALLALVVGALLLFGTQMAFAHGGTVGYSSTQTGDGDHDGVSGGLQEH